MASRGRGRGRGRGEARAGEEEGRQVLTQDLRERKGEKQM